MRLRLFAAFAVVGSPLLLYAPWATPSPAAQTFEGTLLVVWGDPHPDLGFGGEIRYMLALSDGTDRVVPLQLTGQENVAVAYFKQQVVVSGRSAASPSAVAGTKDAATIVVDTIAKRPAPLAQTDAAAAVTGTRRVVYLLVKFSDDATVPHPPDFYTALNNPDTPPPGAAFPATVNGFFRKTSWDQLHWLGDVGGMGGVGAPGGWLTLPHPKSYYADCGSGGACAKLHDLAADATALGKAQGITFADYDQINFVLSNDLDCCAWGGGHYFEGKFYGATWVPPWGQEAGLYVHEMGHSLGLPHSGWMYQAYDSPWDMMSRRAGATYSACGTYLSANLGAERSLYCSEPGDGYIAVHKDHLGWIPPANTVVTDPSSPVTVTLDGGALPLGSATKMIRICIPGFSCTGAAAHYFTVEARVKGFGTDSQFDNAIPAEGVIIHDVQFDRPPIGGPCFFNSTSGWAVPVDSTPGDYDSAACNGGSRPYPHYALYNAHWSPGETYTNDAHGLRIDVLSRTGTAFVVSVGTAIHPHAPVTVTAENAAPLNGTPDPGETLTASFPLTNLGAASTTNLVATLLATGGVTSPSAPQAYGALVGGGPAVARPFTFKAAGACGDTITATFSLQDGATYLGTASFALKLGATQIGSPQAFTNATPILVPANQGAPDAFLAEPYPSSITVSGVAGAIHSLTATLHDFNHTYPADVDMLLVSPAGQKMIIIAGAGGGWHAAGANVTLDDTAATGLPDGTDDGIVSGAFRPTSFSFGPTFGPPAPGSPYLTPAPVGADTLTGAFAGTNPNGAWSLYTVDTFPVDDGTIGGGWEISVVPETHSCSVPAAVPGPPTGLSAVAGNAQASVSFAAPADNGSSPVTGYTATCTPTAGVPVAAAGPTSPIVNAGLTNGVTYTCTVHAINDVGDGPESSPTNPVTPSAAPPAALTVTLSGSGTGTVASSPPGIACPGDCAETYPAGTGVVLTAAATGSSLFTGWLGGACTGTSATCNVAVNTAAIISATFAAYGTVATLDIDLSGQSTNYDPLTDGLLILRYLFGLTEASLTTGALDGTATLTDPAVIKARLDDIRPALDVDGNGTADALTDGLLISRYLRGLRASALITGAVDPLATRKTALDVEAYLATLVP